jgi:hypothetical protein
MLIEFTTKTNNPKTSSEVLAPQTKQTNQTNQTKPSKVEEFKCIFPFFFSRKVTHYPN